LRAPRDGGLRPLFHSRLKAECQWSSIETGVILEGVPDSEYCFKGGLQGWIEFKATPAWRVKLQPLQVAWIARRARLGGRVHVAIRRAAIGPDELWLVQGRYVAELANEGLRSNAFSALSWTGGPSRWDWRAIRRELTR